MKPLYGSFHGSKLVRLTFAKGMIRQKKSGKSFTLPDNTVYLVTDNPERVFDEFSDILTYEVLGDAILIEEVN
jgi:hypothetical protein